MDPIARVIAREVLDSRGDPTVEVEVHCASGACGSAIVPAGASTGRAEARELRDGDSARYGGRGVRRAVHHVREVLGPVVRGCDPTEQSAIDQRLRELDGTPSKERLGANAILGVSLAVAHAAAASRRLPLFVHLNQLWCGLLARQPHPADAGVLAPRLPLPMTNMISGGLHAGGNLDFQDFMALPTGSTDYAQQLEWLVRLSRALSRLLSDMGHEGRLVADEGGFGPRLPNHAAALEVLTRAIERAGLRPAADVQLAIDVAATHFYRDGTYVLTAEGQTHATAEQMIDRLDALSRAFPVASIEDGLAEDDWLGWQQLTRRLGHRVQLVGDDLFATHPARLLEGIRLQAANAVLVKLNQIGTLSETLELMCLAHRAGYRRVVSARSGETEDTTIADLAVATAAEQIKIGAVQRGERLAKYNRLLRIAELLEAAA
jgi:enolase